MKLLKIIYSESVARTDGQVNNSVRSLYSGYEKRSGSYPYSTIKISTRKISRKSRKVLLKDSSHVTNLDEDLVGESLIDKSEKNYMMLAERILATPPLSLSLPCSQFSFPILLPLLSPSLCPPLSNSPSPPLSPIHPPPTSTSIAFQPFSLSSSPNNSSSPLSSAFPMKPYGPVLVSLETLKSTESMKSISTMTKSFELTANNSSKPISNIPDTIDRPKPEILHLNTDINIGIDGDVDVDGNANLDDDYDDNANLDVDVDVDVDDNANHDDDDDNANLDDDDDDDDDNGNLDDNAHLDVDIDVNDNADHDDNANLDLDLDLDLDVDIDAHLDIDVDVDNNSRRGDDYLDDFDFDASRCNIEIEVKEIIEDGKKEEIGKGKGEGRGKVKVKVKEDGDQEEGRKGQGGGGGGGGEQVGKVEEEGEEEGEQEGKVDEGGDEEGEQEGIGEGEQAGEIKEEKSSKSKLEIENKIDSEEVEECVITLTISKESDECIDYKREKDGIFEIMSAKYSEKQVNDNLDEGKRQKIHDDDDDDDDDEDEEEKNRRVTEDNLTQNSNEINNISNSMKEKEKQASSIKTDLCSIDKRKSSYVVQIMHTIKDKSNDTDYLTIRIVNVSHQEECSPHDPKKVLFKRKISLPEAVDLIASQKVT